MKKEIRQLQATLEARSGEQAEMVLEGHAAVFNKVADLGWFTEEIEPGAFRQAIVEDDVRALLNHDPNYVLGRNKAGTLQLIEDETGLKVRIQLPDTQSARDIHTSVQRGDIDQMSFMFEATGEEWRKNAETKKDHRVLKGVKLYDVSVVTFPAYSETDVSARGAASVKEVFETHQQVDEEVDNNGLDPVEEENQEDSELARVRMVNGLRKKHLTILEKEQ